MSLEYAIEKYPMELALKDGTACVIRPLVKRDRARMHRFLRAVPEEERLYIKDRVSDAAVVAAWCKNLDYEKDLPLLMLHGSLIIGEATLHQRSGGWKRHVGLVTVLTHPSYRGRDVAKTLVRESIEVAQHLGLKKLEAELNGERSVALRALQDLGFRQLFRLEDYLLDMTMRPHDYVMLGMDLVTDEEFAGAA